MRERACWLVRSLGRAASPHRRSGADTASLRGSGSGLCVEGIITQPLPGWLHFSSGDGGIGGVDTAPNDDEAGLRES